MLSSTVCLDFITWFLVDERFVWTLIIWFLVHDSWDHELFYILDFIYFLLDSGTALIFQVV